MIPHHSCLVVGVGGRLLHDSRSAINKKAIKSTIV
jgi:hypothetical protein